MIISDEETDHDAPVESSRHHPKVACKRRQGKTKKQKQRKVTTCPTQVKEEDRDWDHIQKCLGWKPMDVCEKTLKATTQYARNTLRLPLRDHYKARFPPLNVRRLNETFVTDTFSSLCKALGGYMCAQIYVGKTSILMVVFPMQSESQMGETLQDFIRKWGAPHSLLSDNAK